jgi:hypothetical protein
MLGLHSGRPQHGHPLRAPLGVVKQRRLADPSLAT